MDLKKAQKQWKPSVVTAFLAATVATVLSFALANVAFSVYALHFSTWRQARTEFVFSPIGCQSPISLGICIALGTIAVLTMQWAVPILLVFVFNTISGPVLLWSGPGYLLDAVMPLITVRPVFVYGALVLNAAFLILYVVRSNRAKAMLIALPNGPDLSQG